LYFADLTRCQLYHTVAMEKCKFTLHDRVAVWFILCFLITCETLGVRNYIGCRRASACSVSNGRIDVTPIESKE